MPATTIHDLPTPALVLDLQRLLANLDQMAERANRWRVALRPHVKTHKSVEIARLQRDRGCRGLTVSTLAEARVFAHHGFDDLTWAFPLILGRLGEARGIAEMARLGVVVDSDEAVTALEAEGSRWRTWLKVDCGYHRAGVDPASDDAVRLARRLTDSGIVRFAGILTHGGHAYHGPRDRIVRAARQEREVMAELAERLRRAGAEPPEISIGSTPGLSVDAGPLDGITEIRPGNYAFYDYTQVVLGSCPVEACALTVVASVVSTSRDRGRSVVDAGALALSSDPGPATAPQPTMGELFADPAARRLDGRRRLLALSQEHGIVEGHLPVGSRVRILPNHSCLTAACFDEYAVAEGERVVDRWKIWRGR